MDFSISVLARNLTIPDGQTWGPRSVMSPASTLGARETRVHTQPQPSTERSKAICGARPGRLVTLHSRVRLVSMARRTRNHIPDLPR